VIEVNLLLWIVFGAIAGWLASVIMKSDEDHGVVTDIVLGVIGGVVGGFVMGFFGAPGVTGFNIYSIVVAVLGSVILIALGRMVGV
jgi:uncharacterized membrane protein YeaQ/YmgE (transglycosylase-associated protein family)